MKKWLIPLLISIIIGSILLAFNIRNNYKFVEVDNNTRQMYINYLNKQVSSSNYKSDEAFRFQTFTLEEYEALITDIRTGNRTVSDSVENMPTVSPYTEILEIG